MLTLSPLTISDLTAITTALAESPPDLSEFTFTNLYAWRAKRPIFHARCGNSLCFFISAEENTAPDKKILFGPPFGSDAPATVLAAIAPFLAGACRVPASLTAILEQHGFTMHHDRDNDDYLYLTEDLATLAGRRFAKKRNKIKQCLADHACTYETITTANLEECLHMQERWCDIRGCQDEPGLDGEYRAIRETFALFDRLNLFGGLIRVRGEVSAYALAERLNPTTAVWHFEKALPDITGLGQLITHWFAHHTLLPAGFMMANREQDLGIPGLRQAKESYSPTAMVKKFTSLTIPPIAPPAV